MRVLTALALATLWFMPALAGDATDMQAVASSLYAIATTSPAGIPDAGTMTRLRPLISPALTQVLQAAMAAQARWSAQNKTAPPLLEGNIFTSLFEGATGFSIGACQADGAHGQCDIDLIYDDKSGRPVRWIDRLLLDRTAQGWRINDIAYGGNWPFANSGRLQDTLKIAIGLSGP